MLWYERKLDYREIEVFFGMIDQAHQKIIDGIKQMIKEFGEDNVYGRVPVGEEVEKVVKSETTESSDTDEFVF